jgi:hypothetical protein
MQATIEQKARGLIAIGVLICVAVGLGFAASPERADAAATGYVWAHPRSTTCVQNVNYVQQPTIHGTVPGTVSKTVLQTGPPTVYAVDGASQWVAWRPVVTVGYSNQVLSAGQWQSAYAYRNSPAPFTAPQPFVWNGNFDMNYTMRRQLRFDVYWWTSTGWKANPSHVFISVTRYGNLVPNPPGHGVTYTGAC